MQISSLFSLSCEKFLCKSALKYECEISTVFVCVCNQDAHRQASSFLLQHELDDRKTERGRERERIVLMRCEDSYLNFYPWIISCWCRTSKREKWRKIEFIKPQSLGIFWHTSECVCCECIEVIEKCTILIFYAELCSMMLRAIIHSRLQLTVILVLLVVEQSS